MQEHTNTMMYSLNQDPPDSRNYTRPDHFFFKQKDDTRHLQLMLIGDTEEF